LVKDMLYAMENPTSAFKGEDIVANQSTDFVKA
jgi:hypothetical protein